MDTRILGRLNGDQRGILDPEDARDAVRFGADGIVVSNHGDRQLDGVLSSARALPPLPCAVAISPFWRIAGFGRLLGCRAYDCVEADTRTAGSGPISTRWRLAGKSGGRQPAGPDREKE